MKSESPLLVLILLIFSQNVFPQTIEVNPDPNQPALKLKRNEGYPTIKSVSNGTDGNIVIDPATNEDAVFLGHYTNSDTYISTGGGNVGIGTITPTSKLDVEGGDFYLGEEVSQNGQRRQMRIYGYDNNSQFYGTIHSNWEDSKRTFDIYTSNATNQLKIDASSNSDARIAILPGENTGVGIGTINPGEWKLAVNGNIRAKEIKVETGWSDFVFYDDYQLPTLEEVEKHIKKNGHLKDIPSAKEVEDNGIFLGQMNSKLLQKIEELTLYTIEQQKEIKKQQKEILELKSLVKKVLEQK